MQLRGGAFVGSWGNKVRKVGFEYYQQFLIYITKKAAV